jgi:hypothetical protein
MSDMRQIANELEWSNYARTAYFATVVPGIEISISSEVVLITDPSVPLVDGNHAAMLHTTPDRADALIERIVEHYRDRGLRPYVVISPGCTPDDLPRRLEAHGFTLYGDPEVWLTLGKPFYADALRPSKKVVVREIGAEEIPEFCRVMAIAYEMPEDTVPILARNFQYINDLPGIHNYLAYVNDEPVGCMSMFSYMGYGALGGGGVIPSARKADVAVTLAIRGYQDWKKDGNKVMVFQTVLPKMERMLRIGGCQRRFTRAYYVLR